MNIRDLQNIELEILKQLDDICKKNDLKYYLAYGTLIGAVRHHGFIPWDDDVDVLMPRSDYNKLINIFNNKKGSRYKLLSLYDDTDYYLPYAKLVDSKYKCEYYNTIYKKHDNLGLWVDIFPLDWYDKKTNYKWPIYIKEKIYACSAQTQLKFDSESKKSYITKILKTIAYLLFSKSDPRKHARKLDYEVQKCTKETNELFVGISSLQGKNIFNKEWFRETIYLKFEDYSFPCPIGYHYILTSLYGDYMQLPPESEKNYKHYIIVNGNLVD